MLVGAGEGLAAAAAARSTRDVLRSDLGKESTGGPVTAAETAGGAKLEALAPVSGSGQLASVLAAAAGRGKKDKSALMQGTLEEQIRAHKQLLADRQRENKAQLTHQLRVQEEVKRLEKSVGEAESLCAKDPPIEKLFYSAKPGVATGMALKKLSGVRDSS